MGRHSAPDDPDDAPESAAAVAVRERDETDGAAPESVGRHSRHDADPSADVDPSAETAPLGAAVINGVAPPRPRPTTRPAVEDDADATLDELIATDDITQRIPPVVDEPPPAERPAPVDAPIATDPPPGHAVFRGAAHNSAADLHLVRSHRGVLAACAAAVVLPFVVEIVVLIVLGTVDGHSVLVWLWAPLVVAGVLLGVVLDIAHRRHTTRQATEVSAS